MAISTFTPLLPCFCNSFLLGRTACTHSRALVRGPGNEASTRGVDKGSLAGCTKFKVDGGYGMSGDQWSECVSACLCACVVPTLDSYCLLWFVYSGVVNYSTLLAVL